MSGLSTLSRIASRLMQPGLIAEALNDSRSPKRVITLDDEQFEHACRDLGRIAAKRFQPDIVVGIRTGGYVVAEAMRSALPAETDILPIRKQRPSTKLKSEAPWRKSLLQSAPYAATDRVRLLEHRLLMANAARKNATPRKTFIPDPVEGDVIEAALKKNPKARVLVVDDSIDSGSTMSAVVGFVQRISPEADVGSAVVVVTHHTPTITPDYCLYRGVLCRFPWSDDFKRPKAQV